MSAKFIPHVEDLIEDLGVTGIAAVVLLPVLIPVAAGVGKPVVKTAIKGGILLYEKAKGSLPKLAKP